MSLQFLSSPLVMVFIAYVAAIFIIGTIAHRQTKNMADYILGGRRLSGPVTGLGAGASDMSGWLLMALPGSVFIHGINQIWLPIGLACGAFLNWYFVAARLRDFTQACGNALTIPAYLSNRFGDDDHRLRLITAIVILIFFTFYAGAGFVAGAFLTQSIFHLSYASALWLSAGIIIIYTCIGGFLAVSWIDFFQASLMFIALLIVPIMTIYHLHGWQSFSQILINHHHPDFFNAFHGIDSVGVISLLAWGFGYFGQPHILVRFMAAKSSNVIPTAQLICIIWMILAMYGALFTGLAGNAYFNQLANPETVFLSLATAIFNPWAAGFLIAAVLSAIMSTVSAQLLSSASALAEDIYQKVAPRSFSHQKNMLLARLALLIIAVAAIGIAYNPQGTILKLVSYAWAGLGAAFGPVIICSLYLPKMTRTSAISGLIAGAATVIIWELLDRYLGGIFHLYSIIPGFGINLLAIWLTSYLDEKVPETRHLFR